MTSAVPSWISQPWAGVHDIPSGFTEAPQPLSWDRLKATAQLWVDSIIGRIAISLGGISIGGWKPLGFLADWGAQRIADAQRNYAAAVQAQDTANFANTQITILTGGALASDVPGGVSISDQFTGPASSDLGVNWFRRSDGPGGGAFGRDGNGRATWKRSGGRWRHHYDVTVTPLATDFQAVFAVIAEPVQSPKVGIAYGTNAFTMLTCRSNSAGYVFVYARVGFYDLQLGCRVDGAWRPWTTITLGDPGSDRGWLLRGDQLVLIAGTATHDRQFIVRQNGIERLSWTDSAGQSAMGVSNRFCGIVSQAGDRMYIEQTVPAQLDTWSAADRRAAA